MRCWASTTTSRRSLNHELAADLSGSNAEKAKLTQTVMQLDGSLDHARELTLNIAFRPAMPI